MASNKLISCSAVCDIGCVRGQNQDMILLGGDFYRDQTLVQTYELSANARFPAIVADGMGGHQGGDVASQFVLQQFNTFILNLPDDLSLSQLTTHIQEWVSHTHRNLMKMSLDNPLLEGMGTTFCGLLFYKHIVLSLNIGDSRMYRFRNQVLKQITTDHSMRQLANNDALPSNQIYNSLGAGANVFIDIKDLSSQLFSGDQFLICSDGLVDMISDEAIEQSLIDNATSSLLVEKAKVAGGNDNISVVLLKINSIDP